MDVGPNHVFNLKGAYIVRCGLYKQPPTRIYPRYLVMLRHIVQGLLVYRGGTLAEKELTHHVVQQGTWTEDMRERSLQSYMPRGLTCQADTNNYDADRAHILASLHH